MTNEEKAREILDIRYNTRCHHQYLIDDLIKMAKWKDKQFVDIISYLEDRMGDEISVEMIEKIKCRLKLE